MDTFNKLTAPASVKLRQLQKMVQDIKKNDGSILNRLRRFQNKSSPKLPVRDYQGNDVKEEQRSEKEFDSDTYEVPQEEKDDSYEPPPCQRVFTSTSSASFPRGDYIDSCRSRPHHSPRKPIWPPKTTKPSPSPSLPPEEDYVNPESDNEDNYINPTEESPANRPMHGRGKLITSSRSMSKTVPERSNSPDVYEVPDMEENSPPPVSRPSTLLRVPTQSLPPRSSPRMHIRNCHPIPIQEPIDDDEYEVCNPDTTGSTMSVEKPLPALPKPMPRETKPLKPYFRTRPDIASGGNEGKALATRHINQKLTATPQPSEYKRAMIPLPQMLTSHKTDRGTVPTDENGLTDAEEGTDVLNKPWYASTCDRKTAEDALVRSNKDGSFLIRKSSGQDTQQPYTLVVFYNSRVYNIPVRYVQASQRYALGREKKGEEHFTSVSHIIENHQRNPLVLIDSQSNTKDSTKLCYAVNP
ncbi:B-cell linker protein isoform X1 [Salmo salar]|uniref:B-cell linker protein isoform X1 n=1 Tax=Salmo salar TaxID=8030 RepID=A0A1S3RNN5_SALSA|nr:B-cell linker protein isoform X1 [Salmo salar]|eukprot:XP_014053930.1 PREDICTED: B-cell linker protein isoform X1 [Salmo salar]